MLALRDFDDRLALQRQQELLHRTERKRLIRLARQHAPADGQERASVWAWPVARPRLALPWG